MAGSLLPEPKQQFLNDIGIPLFAGKIFTYAAGTLTPKATYQDRDLTILNTNPVIANARGEVVMYGSGNYRIILQDLAGVTIYDRDNVETPDSVVSGLLSSLSGPNGANQVGLSAPTSPSTPTNVGAFLNNIHGIDVTLYGASPSASSATNTTAINAANLLSVTTGIPVYFPPVGLIPHDRLADVTGNLVWVGGDQYVSGVKIGSSVWPYTSSGAPMLKVNGSFRYDNLNFDQAWKRSAHPLPSGYRDGYSPRTWGGFFYVEVNCNETGVVESDRANFDNAARGILVKDAKLVDIKNASSRGRDSWSQTVIATSECQEVWIDAELMAMMWNEGATYVANGNSGFYPWNCGVVQKTRLICEGHQLVERGPLSWAANTAYVVGDEYRVGRSIAYRVKTAYTSGATFGSADTNAADVIYYGMKLNVYGYVHMTSPIADTAPYDWATLIVNHLEIYNSGDMGLATSSCDNVHIAFLHVDGVRVGGLDLSYNVSFSIGSVTIRNFARASDGLYSRIDQFGRFASAAGYSLAAVALGAQVTPGSRSSLMNNVKIEFDTLPPLTDPQGDVLSKIFGIFAQPSPNPAHYHAITSGVIVVPDLGASAPNFFFQVSNLRFNLQAITGTPLAGDIFTNGSVKFVLVAQNGPTGLAYVRKLVGAIVGSTVFTGTNGATLTIAASPITSFLDAVEGVIYDKTSKFY